MWIITRNEHQALANDGSWTGRHHADELRTFDSHEAANVWIEQESLPEEFVSVANLRALVAEQYERRERQQRQDRRRLRRCQYVALEQTEKFYRSSEVDDDWAFPVFEWFEVTHSVLHEGTVVGALGRTPNDHLPFHCYTFDAFYFAFEECYTREQPDRNRHDFRQEGF